MIERLLTLINVKCITCPASHQFPFQPKQSGIWKKGSSTGQEVFPVSFNTSRQRIAHVFLCLLFLVLKTVHSKPFSCWTFFFSLFFFYWMFCAISVLKHSPYWSAPLNFLIWRYGIWGEMYHHNGFAGLPSVVLLKRLNEINGWEHPLLYLVQLNVLNHLAVVCLYAKLL